ncbi:MAG TPA: DUF1475 family protein [Opitutaceae bacterium]|nr:DUF1475 family protein [Opitutaceae bacterium]
MITALRALFLLVLTSMIWVTTWAGLQCPLFSVPAPVAAHPWFVATMFDAYWGFTTFYVWVCYKETSWTSRIAWFVAVMALGNIAMASYCLAELSRAPRDGRLSDVLVARRSGAGWLGAALALAGVAVVVAAAMNSHPRR